MRDKTGMFAKRSGGGRPVKMDRAILQRRKTQPITFDDIARANQNILDSLGNIGLGMITLSYAYATKTA